MSHSLRSTEDTRKCAFLLASHAVYKRFKTQRKPLETVIQHCSLFDFNSSSNEPVPSVSRNPVEGFAPVFTWFLAFFAHAIMGSSESEKVGPDYRKRSSPVADDGSKNPLHKRNTLVDLGSWHYRLSHGLRHVINTSFAGGQ